MRYRTLLLSGVLAAGISLTMVPRAASDPRPSAGAWDDSRDHAPDDPPYYRAHRGYGDPQYSQLVDRIDDDLAKIAEIESTGRHREALQWYENDLRDARRDMRNFRRQMEAMPGTRV